ncbi:MAG: hypothetical protein FWD13_07395 [Treponema sp.]|nr:hypothetical protein [Treponema sp.]
MCPEPQLLSIYVDGELPSPWDEKLESHLNECSICREKLESFKKLHDLLKKDTNVRRTIVDKRIIKLPSTGNEPKEHHQEFLEEPELVDAVKKRVWKNLSSRQHYRTNKRIWKRKLSIPIPAIAAAAIAITLMTGLLVYSATVSLNDDLIKKQNEAAERVNFNLAAEEEMSSISTTADIYGVFQYLSSNGAEIIVLELPPETSFHRAGEPAILRAADYQRTEVQRNRPQRNDEQRNNENRRGRGNRNEVRENEAQENDIPRIPRNHDHTRRHQ